MKKLLLFVCMAVLATAQAYAQGKNPQQNHQGAANTYGQDVTIEPSVVHQLAVKITTAFNGWQYAAFSTFDTLSSFTGGITVVGSRDNGATWNSITTFGDPFYSYPSLDVVVAGTDTNALTLYLARVENYSLDNSYSLFIDEYNATAGTWLNETLVAKNDSGAIRDVAIASDYAFPSDTASPYSVGLLYSSSYISNGSNPSADSVIYIASLDGGTSWGVTRPVAIDSSGLNYFRKVAISYGYSPSAGGRYFGAWESINNLANRTGSIYTSRSDSTVSDPWIAGVNLDSLTASTAGLCKNPAIAISVDSADNGSGGVSAVVLVDRDSLGDGSSNDVLGFYNLLANYNGTWSRLNVTNTAENDLQPDISYITGIHSFACTYFDATNQSLPYLRNDENLAAPNTWTVVTSQYNDVASNLDNPWPQVSIYQAMNVADWAWIQSDGAYLQAMFDAENSTVSIPGHERTDVGLAIFPNPAIHDINVNVTLKSSSRVRIDIYDVFGQLMMTRNLGTMQAGSADNLINIDALANGNYLVKVTSDRFVNTKDLIIAR